ncbi:unnamed protein product, partial [marine sediment metagenome]
IISTYYANFNSVLLNLLILLKNLINKKPSKKYLNNEVNGNSVNTK